MYIYVCETHKMNASWASYIKKLNLVRNPTRHVNSRNCISLVT